MRSPGRWVVALVAAVAAAVGSGAGTAVAQSAPGAEHSLRASETDQDFYFVMADRFANGSRANDLGGLPADRLVSGYDPTARGFYHGGDLRGVRRRLNYIAGLGTSAIWLTPSFKNRAVQLEDGPSAGYHGYWITDFTQIDPHLGTNQDLKDLIGAAHARGIKVYFDIITNHTADVIQYREGARTAYVSKDQSPYRTAAGDPFDDRDFAGSDAFPALDPEVSFPYHPFVPAGAPTKVPAWLNDVTLYHNRGNTTYTGEDSQYGDFAGLDDLFTENPRVVRGMIDIYEGWIRDFGIDGFRIDTMKHVDDAFWQQFAPQVLDYAHAHGKPDFFMFGEVADSTRPLTSHYTTTDRVQSVLDFPFQAAAQDFAANSGSAEKLSDLFVDDDWYTDPDSNAYQLTTFLGNHDMGRIGHFIAAANPGASDAELLARDRLAHALMYFARGNPVVYYGDEQGFTGDGGDQLARQDMFPSQVADYNDDDLIGSDATTAQSNFDRSQPLYRSIARLARLTRDHPALRNGAQQDRWAADGPGLYAFSRIDRTERREYVVVLNDSESARTAPIPTYAANRRYAKVYGPAGTKARLRTGGQSRLRVTVPALSAVVYESDGRIPASAAAPTIGLAAPAPSDLARGRMEVRADVRGDSFYEVTFQAKVGDGDWQDIGTDDNAPYRVFHDVSGLAPGTSLQYRAIVLDDAGHARTSRVRSTDVPDPAVTLVTPAAGAKVRGQVKLLARTDPERPSQSVTFQRRTGDGPWTDIATDTSSPEYSVVDDISGLGLAPGTELRYRAVLHEGDVQVTSRARSVVQAPPPVTTAIIHYRRPAGDYAGWGIHVFGPALLDSVTVDWNSPLPPAAIDDFGARFEVPLDDDTATLSYIIHQPGGDVVPTTREPGGDRSFVPVDSPEVWVLQGDPTIYTSRPPGT